MIKSRIFSAWYICGLLLMGSATVQAAYLDFNVSSPTTTGQISYAGGGNPLIGSNIEVDTVVGTDGALSNNNIVSDCLGCKLNFTSGAFSSTTSDSWIFGGGGMIQITGAVDFPFGTDIPADTLLLDGTFTSVSVYKLEAGSLAFYITGATFTDEKNDALLDFYGFPTGVGYEGGMNISFFVNSGVNVGDAFTSTSIASGNITNQVVPVPAAVWLFGSGLLGLAGIARRKKAA